MTTSGNGKAIIVIGLTKRFGALTAVNNLHLEVAPGEAFALVGPDGAGTILNDYGAKINMERFGRQGSPAGLEPFLAVQEQTWFNLNRESRYSFVPGVIAMVVMFVSLNLTAMSVVREKEIGTMEQLLVTPINPLEVVLGKTIPFMLISLFDVFLLTLVAIFWFEVPFRGNALVLFLGTLLFLINTVGLGLFISTVSSTQQQAMMVSTFFLFPIILLSGLIFPIPNMPQAIQYLTYLNPLSYFMIVLQDIFLKGVGLAILIKWLFK